MDNLRYAKIPALKKPLPNKRQAKRWLKKTTPLLIIVALTLVIVLSYGVFSGSGMVFRYVFGSGSSLHSQNDQLNVLLLGLAGGTHDGAYLTDTIMVASLNIKTKQLYLISMPRDLWLDFTKSKANAVYEIGMVKNQAIPYSKQVMGDVLGMPIDYVFRIDFSGFVKAVDTLGGVDVNVERSFDDYEYPITGKEDDLCGLQEKEVDLTPGQAAALSLSPGKQKALVNDKGQVASSSADFACRFEHILFKAGLTHMDGTTALKFVRSRKGNNGEGTDFARSRRQHLVIEAVKGKALSLSTLASPQKLSSLMDSFGKSIDTDISITDALQFYQLSKDISQTNNVVLSNEGEKPLLINPPLAQYGGAWVLIPKDNNFDGIHQYMKQVLAGEVRLNEASASARTGN